MSRGPVAPEYVRNLAVYVPGKPIEEVRRELGITDQIVKLASNENPLGASPRALEAIRKALAEVHRYPDGGGFYLRQALADRFRLTPDSALLGNGSSEIIEMLAHAYLADGDEAIFSQQSFVMYPIAIASVNGRGVAVPATRDRRHDVDAILAAVTDRTKLIFVANPSNPTGTYIARPDLSRLLAGVPESVLVLVDQAYQEYVEEPDYPDALDDLREGRNVAILRTFSKIYGLAGIRIGYVLGPADVIHTLNRIRSPFNTSHVAQAAGCAALEDEEWVLRCRTENARERTFLQTELSRRGVAFTPSVTNFLLIQPAGALASLITLFEKRGVIIRPVGGPGLANFARVSVGTRAENEKFLAALDALHREGKV
ncbi:MAG: histidinol-phosphate transaminase [Candidatus Eisenbacteria bacterium]|nr:histidinol-phosphate transaminase [Candidatus Eisenbacteria bacterium]